MPRLQFSQGGDHVYGKDGTAPGRIQLNRSGFGVAAET